MTNINVDDCLSEKILNGVVQEEAVVRLQESMDIPTGLQELGQVEAPQIVTASSRAERIQLLEGDPRFIACL
jgi:hypothetical protein